MQFDFPLTHEKSNLNEQYEQIDQEMAQLSQKLQEYKANISEKESLKEGRRRSFSSNQVIICSCPA